MNIKTLILGFNSSCECLNKLLKIENRTYGNCQEKYKNPDVSTEEGYVCLVEENSSCKSFEIGNATFSMAPCKVQTTEGIRCGNGERQPTCKHCESVFGPSACSGKDCGYIQGKNNDFFCVKTECQNASFDVVYSEEGNKYINITLDTTSILYYNIIGGKPMELTHSITFHNKEDSFVIRLNNLTNGLITILKQDFKINSLYRTKTSFKSCSDQDFDTTIWNCNKDDNKTKQFIRAKQICDGTVHCRNKADEADYLCKGGKIKDISQNFGLSLLFYCIMGTILVASILHSQKYTKTSFGETVAFGFWKKEDTYLAQQTNRFLTILKKNVYLSPGLILEKKESDETENALDKDVNEVGITSQNISTERIAVGIEEGTASLTWKNHPEMVKSFYETCKQDNRNGMCFKIVHILAAFKPFQVLCETFIDVIIRKERQIHGEEGKMFECILSWHGDQSYVSAWLKNVAERKQFFSKIVRKIEEGIAKIQSKIFRQNDRLIYHIGVMIDIITALFKVAMFYRDFVVDVILIYIIYHLDYMVLQHLQSDIRYHSVAGINFRLLYYYLIFVLIFSEIWLFLRSFKIRKEIAATLDIDGGKIFPQIIITVFPIHVLILGKFNIEYGIRKLNREIALIFERMKSETDENLVAENVVVCTRKFDRLNHKLFNLTKLFNEIQVIESCGEREFQLVVQLILFVNAQYFERIKYLFDDQLGIGMEYLFIINWIIGMITLTNSIINYKASSKFPFKPSILGKILRFLAVYLLLTGKLIFIAATLCTYPYLHLLAHAIRFITYLLLFRCINGKSFFENGALVNVLTVSAAGYKCENVAKPFATMILNAFGGVLFVTILELLTFGFYGGLGMLVRNPKLIQLCKTSYLCSFTEPDSIDETEHGLLGWLYKESFQLYNPYLLVAWAILTIICYLLLSSLYYKLGHPRKECINQK